MGGWIAQRMPPGGYNRQPAMARRRHSRIQSAIAGLCRIQASDCRDKTLRRQRRAQPHLMMQQYFALKSQHTDKLLFYRMGDFYELFYDGAEKPPACSTSLLTTRGQSASAPCAWPAFRFMLSSNTWPNWSSWAIGGDLRTSGRPGPPAKAGGASGGARGHPRHADRRRLLDDKTDNRLLALFRGKACWALPGCHAGQWWLWCRNPRRTLPERAGAAAPGGNHWWRTTPGWRCWSSVRADQTPAAVAVRARQRQRATGTAFCRCRIWPALARKTWPGHRRGGRAAGKYAHATQGSQLPHLDTLRVETSSQYIQLDRHPAQPGAD